MSIDETQTRFAILLDGRVTPSDRLLKQLAGRSVIAADGGMRHAETLGLTPEFWVGDFDSSSEDLQSNNAGIKRISVPANKDYSDGALALKEAIGMGADDILVCGATGGPRSDHILFNLAQIAAANRDNACNIWAANGREEHHVMHGPQSQGFDFADGAIFSVFGFTDVTGLTITGAQWPLENVTLTFGSTHTLSNRVHGPLRIDVESGMVFVIAQIEQG